MPISAQYWRIFVNGVTNGSSVVSLAEVAFLDQTNTRISTAGGTFTASSAGGSTPASNAFDQNPNTIWQSVGNPSSASPEWIQVQFSGAVNVVAVALTIRNDSGWPTQSPPTFLVQSSTNGTTWTTENTVTGYNWFTIGQVAYFSASTVVGNLRLSQTAIEIVETNFGGHARLTQLAVETVLNAEPRAKISQVAKETVLNAEPRVKISQVCIEIIYPNIVSPPQPVQQFLVRSRS